MEIVRFLQWQWRQFEMWQKCYFVALFCLGFGLATDNPEHKEFMLTLGGGIIGLMLVKWAVVDSTIKSYNEYKRQRDGLFKEIKGE
jgi:hypothetical protein